MKKLLITRLLPDANIAAAKERFEVDVRDTADGLTVSEAAAALRDYDAILPTLGDQFTAEAFQGEIRCGVLGNFGVGYNHIDVDAAREAGVAVSNTPDVVTDATADIAVALLLAVARNLPQGQIRVRCVA